ncbi:MAG: NADH-quinone oxidoreductase subunit C [Anaerolineaceae bacterium]
MSKIQTSIISKMVSHFGASTAEFHDEITLIIQPAQIVEVCLYLRDEAGFDMLLDATAVDYYPATSLRFHLVYHFYSTKKNVIITLRIPLNGNEPAVHTIEGVYPNANWYEREIWDLMGIRFEGHSDLRRIVLPFDWEGHPLRKDYPLGYEEVQYTFNFDDVNKRKRYPKD